MARPKTLPGDEKYMLGESEHVSELQVKYNPQWRIRGVGQGAITSQLMTIFK